LICISGWGGCFSRIGTVEKMPCATSAQKWCASSQKWEAENRGAKAMRPPMIIAGTIPSRQRRGTMACRNRSTGLPVNSTAQIQLRAKVMTCPWLASTPFNGPIVPDVKLMASGSQGITPTCGSRSLSWSPDPPCGGGRRHARANPSEMLAHQSVCGKI
jgi:hypothetical protein